MTRRRMFVFLAGLFVLFEVWCCVFLLEPTITICFLWEWRDHNLTKESIPSDFSSPSPPFGLLLSRTTPSLTPSLASPSISQSQTPSLKVRSLERSSQRYTYSMDRNTTQRFYEGENSITFYFEIRDESGGLVLDSVPPWTFWEGRTVGPRSKPPETNLADTWQADFNRITVTYEEKGRYRAQTVKLTRGFYLLELVLDFDHTKEKDVYSTWNGALCTDIPVKGTPFAFEVEAHPSDNSDFARLITSTPCKEGDVEGRWVPVEQICRELPDVCSDVPLLQSLRSSHFWQGNSCYFKLYSPESYTTCLAGRSVLMLGDSVLLELHTDYRKTFPTDRADFLWIAGNSTFNLRMGLDAAVADPQVMEQIDTSFQRLRPEIVITNVGIHDIAPGIMGYVKTYSDIFPHFERRLIEYLSRLKEKAEGLSTGRRQEFVVLLVPRSYSGSHCDFLSNPRIDLANEIIQRVAKGTGFRVADYYSMTSGCRCGDIHKGVRFAGYDGIKLYHGSVARVMVQVFANMLCN